MSTRECPCGRPPVRAVDFDRVPLGMDDHLGEVSVETCRRCGTRWLAYLLEEEHRTASGRWWRAPLDPGRDPTPTAHGARAFLESRPWCLVGGSYHGGAVHRVEAPISVR